MPSKKPKTKLASAPEPTTVGQILKARRLKRGVGLAEAERATRIRGKYLVAIETDDFTTLPNDIYSKGFVQSYAGFLGLDGVALAADYARERGRQAQRIRPGRRLSRDRLVLTPRLLTMIGATIAGAAIAVYLLTQVSALTAPPDLQVTNPSRDQVLYGSLITLSGHVNDGADVFVNSSPILVDGNGNFSSSIALQNGVNSIQVRAKSSLGKSSTVTRNILAHVPATDPSALLPQAPFDGVAVSVQVQNHATTVKVTIDGRQQFSGTMLPGTVQTFKGSNSVVIATSDGGATSLTVTNSAVANQNLGTIGPSGQAVSDFEFEKTTQFQ